MYSVNLMQSTVNFVDEPSRNQGRHFGLRAVLEESSWSFQNGTGFIIWGP